MRALGVLAVVAAVGCAKGDDPKPSPTTEPKQAAAESKEKPPADPVQIEGTDWEKRNLYGRPKRILETVTEQDGTATDHVTEFAENGKLTFESTKREGGEHAVDEKKTYKYDAQGRLSEISVVLDGKTYVIRHEYLPDNVVKVDGYDFWFENPMVKTLQHNAKGLVTSRVEEHADGKVTRTTSYDVKGRESEVWVDYQRGPHRAMHWESHEIASYEDLPDGSYKQTWSKNDKKTREETIDQHGRTVKSVSWNEAGAETSVMEVTHPKLDEHNNYLKTIVTSASADFPDTKAVGERTIEYW